MSDSYATRPWWAIAFAGAVVCGMAGAAEAFVCVLVPHFKDEYWLSVGFGLEQEAALTGTALRFHEAGGYQAQAAQIAQVDRCIADGAEALLIGAVSSDHPGLLDAVARAAQAMPVIGLVNALQSDALSAAVGVDWRDMGTTDGAALAERFPAGSPPQRAVLLTGPSESGWVAPLEAGLRDKLHGSSVEIIARQSADTGSRQQFALVSRLFETGPPFDILIGPAPAIEAAMGYLANHPKLRRPLLVASYVSHSVRRGLADGQVAFAPFDDPIEQGRLAMRLGSDWIAGGPGLRRDPRPVGPAIRLVTQTEVAANAVPLSPPGYFPKLE